MKGLGTSEDGKRTVEVFVGGRRMRVLSSASSQDVERIARIVEERIAAVAAGRTANAEVLILAAMSLAHEVEEARSAARSERDRAREVLARTLERLDGALADVDVPMGGSADADVPTVVK